MNGEKRGPGRPRLPTPERRRNVLASKAKWRHENYEYYLNQKRELANRPEYLKRRRELYLDRATKQTHMPGHPLGLCPEECSKLAWQDVVPDIATILLPADNIVPDDARLHGHGKSILDYATLDNMQIVHSSKMDAQPL